MDFGRYLVGVTLTALVLAAAGAAAVAVRRRLLPGWSGAPARLAEATVGLGVLVVVPTLLGAVGLLKTAPVVVGYLAAGVAVVAVARRGGAPTPPEHGPPPAPPVSSGARAVALTAAALLLAEWFVQVIGALDAGMNASDTLSYHGPIAARFVQQASIADLHVVYADPVIVFFPFNSELLHSVGFLLLGSDVLSPLMNMGWLALALLAAWCLGRPKGVGPATLVAAALVLASPALVGSQPGSDGNDVVCVALLLTAAALLVNGWPASGAVGLVALAGGLAVGTKVTMLAPVGALMIGVIVISGRGSRVRTAARWAGLLLLGSAAWYLRNLFGTGSPLPSLKLGIGSLALPQTPQPQTFSVAHYVTDGHIWREWFLPGLHHAFGPLWPVIVVLGLGGAAAALATKAAPPVRVLGAVVLASVLAYTVTPRSADGPDGFPYFFSFTLRYIAPSLALGAGLTALVPRVRSVAARGWALAPLLGVLVVTLWDFGAIATGDRRRLALALGAGVVLALVVRRPLPRPALGPLPAAALAAVALALVVAGGWKVDHDYLRDRYAGSELAFARGLHGARIATVGWVRSYPLYGADFSNHVSYVARRARNGGVEEIEGCRAWRRALDRGGYDYVVTSPPVFPYALPGLEEAKQSPWTRTDPAARVVLRGSDNLVVFRIHGSLDPATC